MNLLTSLQSKLADADAALELALDGNDSEMLTEAEQLSLAVGREIQQSEFLAKMSGPYDSNNVILEINSGSGGTEAQDWALMLLRMYTRWAERHGFKIEELDYQAGEGAGIKSATLLIQGEYAYGFLQSESGVHRLVRISPFDSNARRHTSFASVLSTPEFGEDVDVDVKEDDLKVDTYKSGGAGGQHVNKTESAIRITHIPTGIIVACQNERSQHKNRSMAMRILKAKLFEREMRIKQEKLEQIKGERKKIDFGSQIRSYVLHPYKLVKDLRTDYESSDAEGVLDGDLDKFIEAYLLQ